MILDGPGEYMIGHSFKNMKLEKKLCEVNFYHFGVLEMQPS